MDDKKTIKELMKKAVEIRKKILKMVYTAQSSHVGGALSVVDILTALYFRILSIDPKNPEWLSRDRCILSKGHCCSALYATLATRGLIPEDILDKYSVNGGLLMGHSSLNYKLFVEATSGSLGHGLPMGVGMAIAGKRDKVNYRVFVILSDGECDEGSVWEAAMFASHLKLDNLIAIVDYNKIQSFGRVEEVINLEPFAEKWRSFGWSAREVDGHDLNQLIRMLKNVPFEKGKPSVVIAHTIKGKGVSFMEDKLEWHYRSPNKEQYECALNELNRYEKSLY